MVIATVMPHTSGGTGFSSSTIGPPRGKVDAAPCNSFNNERNNIVQARYLSLVVPENPPSRFPLPVSTCGQRDSTASRICRESLARC